jgi:hypothetical protein
MNSTCQIFCGNSNIVHLDTDEESELKRRFEFVFSRRCGRESYIWIEYLVGSLLDSRLPVDSLHPLRSVNPFLTPDETSSLQEAIVETLLRANRVGQINRCISHARSLISLLRKMRGKATNNGKGPGEHAKELLTGITQTSELLARELTTGRHYVDATTSDDSSTSLSFVYDPRYLVFEFTWTIVLRKQQVQVRLV